MTTRLEEIKNYLAFHNKPSRLADQPLVQDLAWAVARIERLKDALEEISEHEGMTNLADCCVNDSCRPTYEDGVKVAHCSYQYGTFRAFGTCARQAREALAEVEKE